MAKYAHEKVLDEDFIRQEEVDVVNGMASKCC